MCNSCRMNPTQGEAEADADFEEVDAVASPGDTRAEGLRLAARGYAIIRHVLVQNFDGPRPSTLGIMVRKRRHRALVLYLELLTWWPWLSENFQPLGSEVWIRSLTATGPEKSRALTWSPSTLSRTWRELEDMNLIEPRQRSGRLTQIVPRREDGADPYTAPTGGENDWYFVLPDDFWADEWFATLSLPALATLLILLKETSPKKPDTQLPRDRMPDWYGISGKTVQKGLSELQASGLAKVRTEVVKAPLSPSGYTRRVHYALAGPFSCENRKLLQKRADQARRARTQDGAS